MGEQDSTEKVLEDYNDVFADSVWGYTTDRRFHYI